jgi:integrase/recombinase XerD
MKNDRHGKAKILTQAEIQLLFSQGFQEDRDRALFGICLFSACRIREACTLYTTDAYEPSGKVRPVLIIRKANTKGKLATRTIPIIDDLRSLLNNYCQTPETTRIPENDRRTMVKSRGRVKMRSQISHVSLLFFGLVKR